MNGICRKDPKFPRFTRHIFVHDSNALVKNIQHVPPTTCPAFLEGIFLLPFSHILLPFSSFLQDLGKSSNDLLGKDYHFHGASLEVKTQTPSNVAFKVQGSRDFKSNVINGDIEGKWTDKVHGLTLTQTWTTSNILRNQIELDNLIAKGLKLDLSTSLSPDKGSKTAVLNTVYKQSGLHTRASLDVFKVRQPYFGRLALFY